LNAFFNIISKYGYDWLHKKCIYSQTDNFRDTKDAIISTNDLMQDYLDQYITIPKDEKDRIGRDEMFSHFKLAYPIISSSVLIIFFCDCNSPQANFFKKFRIVQN
jgi:hypothetical protein